VRSVHMGSLRKKKVGRNHINRVTDLRHLSLSLFSIPHINRVMALAFMCNFTHLLLATVYFVLQKSFYLNVIGSYASLTHPYIRLRAC